MNDIQLGGWLAPYLAISLPSTSNKRINKYKNRETFQNTFIHNMLTALDRYHIEGLPDTCDERVVLQSLLWYGKVLFFEKSGNVFALPCVNTSEGFTVYGYWISAAWLGLNGMSEKTMLKIPSDANFLKRIITNNRTFTDGNAVLVRENSVMYPFINYVWQYSDYMADTLRTLDTGRVHLKHPYVITAEQSVVNTVKAWLSDTKDNQDIIVNTGVFPADKVNIQDLKVTGDTINCIKELYEWYEAQFLGLCGIAHNAGSDKKGENLLTTEIGVDSESDNTNINISLKCIQQDLDLVNETFNLNLKVVSEHTEDNYDIQPSTTGKDLFADDNGDRSISGESRRGFTGNN